MKLILILASFILLCLSTASQAQFYYPNPYGYAWYPRQYAEGYYRAPYYGGGIGPSCGYYGCRHSGYARPYMRSGFGDYRQYHYAAPHHYYRTVHPRDAGGEFGIGW